MRNAQRGLRENEMSPKGESFNREVVMKKAVTLTMVLVWSALLVGTGLAQTANPTITAHKQMIEKMESQRLAHKTRPRVRKMSGTVDRSLKPRATVSPKDPKKGN